MKKRTMGPIRTFDKTMRRIEADMLRGVVKQQQSQRGELAKILVTNGIKSPALVPKVAGFAKQAATDTAALMAATLPKMDDPTREFLEAQLTEDELRWLPAGPLVDTAEHRSQLADLANAWGSAGAGRLLVALLRLQREGSSVGDAVTAMAGSADDPLGIDLPISPLDAFFGEVRLGVGNALWSLTNETLQTAYEGIEVGMGTAYLKQWVSTVDERTTDCCLRAHGQIVPRKDKFVLEGTPRYADALHSPPGHWNCRSVSVLLQEEDRDDTLTRLMEASRDEELARRAELTKQQRNKELKDVQRKGRRRYRRGQRPHSAIE